MSEDDLTHRQRRRLRTDLTVVLDVSELAAVFGDLLVNAHTAAALLTTADAPSSRWPSGSTHASGVSDPTGSAAAKDSPIDADLAELGRALVGWRESGYHAWRLATRLAAHLTERPHQPPPGAGECVVCVTYVPGLGEDRLKRGMCPAHYQAWIRAGRPVLVAWTDERQRERARFDGQDDAA